MSDAINNTPSCGLQTDCSIAVQPREIKEAAFRSLCAAGADPAEAQEGALAVLRAQAEEHEGLRLLEELLDADWAAPARPTAATDVSWAGGTLREIESAGQPGLRTALQLFDLVTDAPAGEMAAARTSDVRIPALLWTDLVLRNTAARGRQIIIAITNPAGTQRNDDKTDYLTVRDGVLSPAPALEAVTGVIPSTTGSSTVVVALPEPAATNPDKSTIGPQPLTMREKDWQNMYQMSRKYLVPDA
ncbi:hypothetical protein [Arthrobacter sp. NyZ413]|uniref:hypothetical protein n=1 Tax=Arthrobacter sp. NyZ413 TaxID=3144669 RepID=UPI003BF84C3D